jgi:hypothetical protein
VASISLLLVEDMWIICFDLIIIILVLVIFFFAPDVEDVDDVGKQQGKDSAEDSCVDCRHLGLNRLINTGNYILSLLRLDLFPEIYYSLNNPSALTILLFKLNFREGFLILYQMQIKTLTEKGI